MTSQAVAYERAGPTLLAAQPAEAPSAPGKGGEAALRWGALRGHLEVRLNMLCQWRNSWWQHWALLARYLLPRRYMWFSGTQPNPNSMVRGNPINQAILDPTGTHAAYVCAAGMMNGLSSPSRPWWKLKVALPGREASEEEQVWMDTVEERIYTVMAGSNFYDALAQQKEDLVIFGTAPMIVYEDEIDIIRCYNPGAGEYYLAASSAFRVESLYRQFLMTVAQMVEMFTLERCPRDVQGLWRTKGAALEVEKIVCHAIEPNFPLSTTDGREFYPVASDFPWREVYWVWGSSEEQALSTRGFHDQPHTAPRWAVFGNDAYGRSPGMDALPDVMQLQVETARKAEAIEKLVRPPVVADAQLKNQPSSTLPGGVTFVANLQQATGMRPVYQVEPRLQEMMEDLAAIQQRIKEGFFNDIFMMIAQAKDDATAYEIAKKYEEKLQVLGPIIERQQNECHSPAIKRIFRIMERKGLLPPMPKSLAGVPIGIEYVSMIALAQRATATASMERVAGMLGNMEAVFPDAKDNIDSDEYIREYGDLLSAKPKIFRSREAVAQIRAQRARQQQAAQALQATQAGAQAAQTLSQTDVGGGMNALQAILGTAGRA